MTASDVVSGARTRAVSFVNPELDRLLGQQVGTSVDAADARSYLPVARRPGQHLGPNEMGAYAKVVEGGDVWVGNAVRPVAPSERAGGG